MSRRRKLKATGNVRRDMDGAMMGGPDGRCYRVTEPRWYEIGRWLRWLFSKERGLVTVMYNGRPVRLRFVRCPCINR